MKKRDLINTLREKFGYSWRECEKIIDTIFSTIKTELKNNNQVTLRNFGTFKTTKPTTRRFRNIHTGKITTKLIKPKVKFKPSKNILKSSRKHK
jgi:integration host factor subunit alpha